MNMKTKSQVKEVEIVWLRRISQSQPTAWEGRTKEDETVHISYKYGRLEILVRVAVASTPAAFEWVTLLRFYPEWMEAEIRLERNWAETHRERGGRLEAVKREAWMVFERKLLGEMRAENEPGKRSPSGRPRQRVVTLEQLRHWLMVRSDNFERLHRAGAAGGEFPIEVTAWSD
jgi:hypothetical protein